MGNIVILLVLTLVMPQNVPDKVLRLPMDDLSHCWEMAHEWVEKGVTERERAIGGVGVMGACYTNASEAKS